MGTKTIDFDKDNHDLLAVEDDEIMSPGATRRAHIVHASIADDALEQAMEAMYGHIESTPIYTRTHTPMNEEEIAENEIEKAKQMNRIKHQSMPSVTRLFRNDTDTQWQQEEVQSVYTEMQQESMHLANSSSDMKKIQACQEIIQSYSGCII